MPDATWNPWKMTAIGLALVVATAVVTGIVVANWSGGNPEPRVETAPAPARTVNAPARPVSPPPAPRVAAPAPPVAPAVQAQPGVPPQTVVDACNRYAADQAGARDKTIDTVKDAAVGTLLGAAVGAAGGAIADGGKGAGKGAAIGGVVGAGAGTLFGLNENRKNDQRYRDAYAGCMKSRGYAG